MKSFVQRRVRNVGVLMVALAAIWLLVRAQERSLGSSAFTTGYLLLAAVLFLGAVQRSQAAAVFAAGQLGGVAAVAYVCGHGDGWSVCAARRAAVAERLSGYGAGGGVLADGGERIGWVVSHADDSGATGARGRRGDLRADSGVSAAGSSAGGRRGAGSVAASGATTLADFYVERLYAFFEQSRGSAYLLWPTTTRRKSLMQRDAGPAAVSVGPGAGAASDCSRWCGGRMTSIFTRRGNGCLKFGCSCTSG